MTRFGVVFVNYKQGVVGSHKKVPNIINFLYNGTIALDSKALVRQGCGENTNLCFHVGGV